MAVLTVIYGIIPTCHSPASPHPGENRDLFQKIARVGGTKSVQNLFLPETVEIQNCSSFFLSSPRQPHSARLKRKK